MRRFDVAVCEHVWCTRYLQLQHISNTSKRARLFVDARLHVAAGDASSAGNASSADAVTSCRSTRAFDRQKFSSQSPVRRPLLRPLGHLRGLHAGCGGRKGPYYTAAHTTPHTTLHLNKNREALRQRKLSPRRPARRVRPHCRFRKRRR